MNREILFRGKSTDNGAWVDGYYINNYDGDYICIIETAFIQDAGALCIKVIPETVGQYTGLSDNNGNKIFEGDIVKYGNNTGIINHSFGCWCIKLNKPKYRDNPAIDIVFNEYPNEVEIIGNIHDNPELMKG